MTLTHHTAPLNGINIHWVEDGAADAPTLVLLHGYPEFWYSWRAVIPRLAGAGFHVVAPDLRGYNLTSRPQGVEAYRIDTVAGDIAALIRHLGIAPAVLVGHDWGGSVAWYTAMLHPDLLTKLVILNSPHPVPFQRALRTSEQKRKSWYMMWFQVPLLPELVNRLFNFRMLRKSLRGLSASKKSFPSADIAEYVTAWRRPGVVTANLNYYRAMRRYIRDVRRLLRPIAMPTLIIWGDQDPVFVPSVLDIPEEWVPNLRVEHIPEASHFVQSDAPEKVSAAIVAFARE